jgi:hypothetical protein
MCPTIGNASPHFDHIYEKKMEEERKEEIKGK